LSCDCGAATIAAGAKLVIATGTMPVALDSAQGDGTLVKQGAGALTLDRSRAQTSARLRIEAGSVVLAGSQTGAAVEPVAGTKLTVADGRLTAGAAERSDMVELVGSGSETLSVDPADLKVKTVRLQAMEVTLTPQNTSAFVDPPTLVERYANLLRNASFETPVKADKGYGEAFNDEGYSWSSPKVSGSVSQVNVATYNSPWYTYSVNTIPEGRQYAAIQSKEGVSGSLSQTFSAPVRGLYRLTFYMTRRTSRSEKAGQLIASMTLDGTSFFTAPVSDDYRADIDTFKQYSTVLPPLTKGGHTLTISVVADNVTTDRALLVDDLKLFPIAEGEYIHVPNSGFDSATDRVANTPSNGWFLGQPEGTGWTGSAGANSGWGVTRGRSTWFVDYYSTDLLTDYSKFYLQRSAQISTTVNAPRNGRVRFEFLYSNRARKNWQNEPDNRRGEQRPSGHALVAYLDDQIMARVWPTVGDETRMGYGILDVTAGAHTLTISNELNGVTEDVASIVDEVRMVYADSEPEIVPVSAFTDARTYWTSPSGLWLVRNVETGRQVLNFNRSTRADISVNVPSNGYYQIVASLAGGTMDLTTTNGVCNSYLYYPALARVLIGGRPVIRALMQDDAFREYRTAAYLTNGVQTVIAQCLKDGSSEKAVVRLADLKILPMPVPTLADAEAANGTKLVLDANSKINLDFDGTLKTGALKVGDRAYTGILDATTLPGVLTGPGRLNAVMNGLSILVR